jgi:Flp pilus assembly protein TadG
VLIGWRMKPQRKSDGQSIRRKMQSDRSCFQRCRLSRGQAMVTFAAALPALLGLVAMGSDVGAFHYNWCILRKAVDACVLAGAACLPSNPSTATSTAATCRAQNGIQASRTVSVSVSSKDQSIMMSARRIVYYFGKALGLKTTPVAVSATVQIEPVGAATGLISTGFDRRTTPTLYKQYTFMQAQIGSENWDGLTLSRKGASILRHNLATGYQGMINVGDIVSTEPGKIAGPTERDVSAQVSAAESRDSSGAAADHALNDPRVVEVPVVNRAGVQGKSRVQVLGFAMMWLVGTNGNGYVADFIQQVAPDNTPNPQANTCTGVAQVCSAFFPMLTQ